jgi:hypothetical protein
VLRSVEGSSYSAIASLSSGASSYVDTTVQAFLTTYSYKIETVGSHGSATSGAVTATTPLLCISRGNSSAETASNLEHGGSGSKNGEGSDVGLGVDLDDVYGADGTVVTSVVGTVEELA